MTRHATAPRPRATVSAIAVVTLLLAACSSDDDKGSSTTAAAATTAATTAAATATTAAGSETTAAGSTETSEATATTAGGSTGSGSNIQKPGECGLGTGEKATGDPIKIGGIATNVPGIDFTWITSMAKAYFDCVNDNGGINGRPIEYIAEEEQIDPQQIASIASKLIETCLLYTSPSPRDS